jgi:hypothetical protein
MLGFRCGSKDGGWLHEPQTLEVGGGKKTSGRHKGFAKKIGPANGPLIAIDKMGLSCMKLDLYLGFQLVSLPAGLDGSGPRFQICLPRYVCHIFRNSTKYQQINKENTELSSIL